MISRNTNIKLSEKQVAKLEAEAKRRGIETPTTPGIVYALIADLPEVEEELFNGNADGSKHFKS
jgi:hypothetical protein